MAKIPKKHIPIMSLKDSFHNGKYVGMTLDDVLTLDPKYVRWRIEDTASLELDNEAYMEYEQTMKDNGL